MLFVLVGVLAIGSSWLYARYIHAIGSQRALSAAGADLGLMMMASLTTQLWALHGNDLRVLLFYDIVAATGTYLAVQTQRGALSWRKSSFRKPSSTPAP